MVVSALGGPEDNTATVTADAADAAASAALAAELADAAAAEVVADAAAQISAAPGLDVKPDATDASTGPADLPAREDAGVPPIAVDAATGPGVKQEAASDPPGLLADGTGGSTPGDDPDPQPDAVVKPDLAELDAAHDSVVAAAAEGDAADVRAAAEVEADTLDAAGGPTGADTVAAASPGCGLGEMSTAPGDLSEMKAELIENAEASTPANADAAAAEPAEAQRRSSRGPKKRTRWGDDPDEPGVQLDGGAERAVKVKTEPQSIGTV